MKLNNKSGEGVLMYTFASLFLRCASSPVRFSTSTNRSVYPHRPQTCPGARNQQFSPHVDGQ